MTPSISRYNKKNVFSISLCSLYRYRRRKQNCPNCNYSWCENMKDSDMKLRKVRKSAAGADCFVSAPLMVP